MANNLNRKQITKLPAYWKSCFNYCIQYFKTRNVKQFHIKVISHGINIVFWMYYYAAKTYTGWQTSKTGMFLCSTKMWSLTEQSIHTMYPVKMQKSISRISHQVKLPILTWFMSIKLKTDISIFQVSISLKFNYTKMITMNYKSDYHFVKNGLQNWKKKRWHKVFIALCSFHKQSNSATYHVCSFMVYLMMVSLAQAV